MTAFCSAAIEAVADKGKKILFGQTAQTTH
jgi:hypothetical protein